MTTVDYSKDIGRKFGRLTAIADAGSDKAWRKKLLYRCDCGAEKALIRHTVVTGRTKSCGCLRIEGNRTRCKYGMYYTPERSVWSGIIRRCFNPNEKKYATYGGRGITVCDRWRKSFLNFFEDMGKRPDGYCIDRIDTNGNYSPENCRWVTVTENNNNRRDNRVFSYNGKTMTLAQWSRSSRINYSTLHSRLKRGWTIELAVSESIKKARTN